MEFIVIMAEREVCFFRIFQNFLSKSYSKLIWDFFNWSSGVKDGGTRGVGANPVSLVREQLGEDGPVAHSQGELHAPLGLRILPARHTPYSWLVEGASRAHESRIYGSVKHMTHFATTPVWVFI